jgi:Fe-S cluster biogenesis protein NfuA
MKFILNCDVRTEGKVTFRTAAEAAGVTLVEKLFDLSYIEQVHLFENVITVTKSDAVPWDEATDAVKAVISGNVVAHDPDFTVSEAAPPPRDRAELTPEVRQIEEILDRTVRPYLQGDGGDLDVVAYADNRVVVDYQGACGTCPSSVGGTLQAIQSILRDEFNPEVEVVSAIV